MPQTPTAVLETGRPRRTFTPARMALMLSVAVIAATGCVPSARQSALKPKGPDARTLDNLFKPVFYVACAVFVLVQGLIIYCVIAFRRRSDDDMPKQIHGSTKLEIGWTIAPAAILAVIGIFTVGTIFKINKEPKGADVVHVNVIGHRWWWEFAYTDTAPASIDATKGIVTANELHIPAGRPVDLDITSIDVIHNFWPPELNGKLYAIPGRHNKLTLQADNPGLYFGQCAEYCGLSHANMRFKVIADSAEDWKKWVSDQLAGAVAIPTAPTKSDGKTDTDALKKLPQQQQDVINGAALFKNIGCAGCHTIAGYSDGKSGPNLTHLMSRATFAGSIFELNDANLRKWLRNPPAEKPMEPTIVAPGGLVSGMPNLNLTEGQITELIAFLNTLK